MNVDALRQRVNQAQIRQKGWKPMPNGNQARTYDKAEVLAFLADTNDLAKLQDRGRYLRDDAAEELDMSPKSAKGDDYKRLMAAKRAKAEIDAVKAQLDLRERQGELIERDKVRAELGEVGTIINGALDSWPARVSSELAAMGRAGADDHEIRVRLIAEVNELKLALRQALAELEND